MDYLLDNMRPPRGHDIIKFSWWRRCSGEVEVVALSEGGGAEGKPPLSRTEPLDPHHPHGVLPLLRRYDGLWRLLDRVDRMLEDDHRAAVLHLDFDLVR